MQRKETICPEFALPMTVFPSFLVSSSWAKDSTEPGTDWDRIPLPSLFGIASVVDFDPRTHVVLCFHLSVSGLEVFLPLKIWLLG